jgi:dihydropteroate synthase
MEFHYQNKSLDISSPLVMGILNITPDSFYDGGHYKSDKELLDKVEQHLNNGAKILDIGAYSSRPGADFVSADNELKRLLPVVENIIKHFPQTLLSIDTFRANTAQKAIEAGAFMINDISGGSLDKNMFDLIGGNNIPYILMHMRGNPKTMQSMTDYKNVTKEVINELQPKVNKLESKGAKQLIIDPGFGFAKSLDQNFELLKQLKEFEHYPYPLLAGVSRKSMIYKKLGINPAEALNGTTVLNTIALMSGAKILRVHDSLEAQQTIDLLNAL